MFGPNYGAAQSHIGELMQEREDFIQASKAQARRVAELEASLAAATELHGAAQVPRPPPRSLYGSRDGAPSRSVRLPALGGKGASSVATSVGAQAHECSTTPWCV